MSYSKKYMFIMYIPSSFLATHLTILDCFLYCSQTRNKGYLGQIYLIGVSVQRQLMDYLIYRNIIVFVLVLLDLISNRDFNYELEGWNDLGQCLLCLLHSLFLSVVSCSLNRSGSPASTANQHRNKFPNSPTPPSTNINWVCF